jgi:hypothetical protein
MLWIWHCRDTVILLCLLFYILLGLVCQDELETHSEPGSISIFVHYGGYKTNNPRIISGYDVVLTTYGVLTEAYKHVRTYFFHLLINFIWDMKRFKLWSCSFTSYFIFLLVIVLVVSLPTSNYFWSDTGYGEQHF